MKNGKIELLRFAMCISVLLYHLGRDLLVDISEYSKWLSFFANGRSGVEFFFIVSGFLMAKSAKKSMDTPVPAGKATILFLWNKIKRLFIPHILVTAVMICYIIYTYIDPVNSIFSRLSSIFFLQRTGIGAAAFSGVEWYISSMLIAMAVIYPLLKLNYDFTARALAPVGSLLLLGYLTQKYGALPNYSVITGVTFNANIRAVGVMLLGVCCFEASLLLKNNAIIKKHPISLVLTENLCYIVFGLYMLSSLSMSYNALAALICAAGVAITFARDSLAFYNNRFIYFLGELSYPVYLCQNFSRKIVLYALPQLRIHQTVILVLLLSVLLGISVDFTTRIIYKLIIRKTRGEVNA